ncbi:MAG: FMN-binding glutamate synthase family protein [Pseudomonadales bacterium]
MFNSTICTQLIAFGSTRNLSPPGSVSFVNCPFPTLTEDAVPVADVTIGESCPEPYTTHSLFNISGMSYGAISKPAILALSHGARMSGCWVSTGEGGADIVYQEGADKYGVRDAKGELSDTRLKALGAVEQIKMFEIKLSQGAKPGRGGIFPAEKVCKEIAIIRGIPEGQDSISPNRHEDIADNYDLIDIIVLIRNVTGKPVGFKAVLGGGGWLDQLFARIQERGAECAPDFITLDGADGGTGAAPQSLMDYMGLPLKQSLPLLVDKLNEYGLKGRVKVVASGKLITPSEMAWALCIGANFVTSARGFMFSLGCIQALQCNKNTCPTGIATHSKRLQRELDVTDKSERVKNYALNMAYEVCVIAHSCGVKEPRQLTRDHAKVMLDKGLAVPLNELHPDVVPVSTSETPAEALKIRASS